MAPSAVEMRLECPLPMYLLYSMALALGLLLSLPSWLIQMLRHGKYREGLSERLGRVPASLAAKVKPTIWIHAVSVGEVLAVSRLFEELCQHLPQHRIAVSTTTAAGQKLAQKRFGAENVFYFPFDFAFAIRPYFQLLRPELVVLAETELWPNFLRLAHRSGARIVVANARISDRSWPGYRRTRSILAPVLRNIDLFLAQTQEDARRLKTIGAPEDRIEVTGNLKFDVPISLPPPIVLSLQAALENTEAGPVVVCGSTMEGEEPLLLRSFENVLASHPRAVMVLAPRHPERFAEVADLLRNLGIRFWQRSLWSGEALAGGILLLDTIGELASIYALADVAFVGGSLVPHGGHNILEPAQHGVAIIVGNHTENFRDIVGLFQSRDAVRVAGPAEFPLILLELLSNERERTALARRAAETLRSQMGATGKTIQALERLLHRRSASNESALPTPTMPTHTE
jgi:3-deoxy-D-manno-octulosonic-acid transferase